MIECPECKQQWPDGCGILVCDCGYRFVSIDNLKTMAAGMFKTEVEKALGPQTPNLKEFVQSIERQQAEARAANTTSGKPTPASGAPTKASGQ